MGAPQQRDEENMTSQKTDDADRPWASSRSVHRLVRGARHLGAVLLAAGLTATAALPASAARLGFVIGNNDYRPPLTPLSNAANDAADIAAELRRAGFTAHDRWVVLNGRRDQMRDAFADFAASIGTGDEVFFFYSGHGVQIDARAALLPVDLRDPARNPLDGRLRTVSEAVQAEQQVLQESLLLNEVASRIAARAPKFSMLVVDACRDNPVLDLIRRANLGKGATNAGAAGFLIEQESPTQLLFFAAGRGQQALDRLSRADRSRNGVFTRVFLEEMRKPGVALRQLVQQTEARVTELAATVRNERGEPHLQTPFSVAKFTFTGDQFRFFGASGADDRRLPAPSFDTDQLACDAARSNGSAGAWRAYLSEYPSGKCASVARVAIATPTLSPSPEPQRAGGVFRDCQQAHCPEMVLIPSGRFMMGSNEGGADEKPPHQVSIRSFALGKYEVTQGQWKAVMGENPSHFKECGDSCPVENVSWDEIQQYLQKLNQMTGQQYRLPSEAEWEYAARAGSNTKYSWGDEIGKNNANCDGCGSRWDKKSTAPVGSFAANAYGLHDMQGNVWEWVQDVWHDNYQGAPTDGSAWQSGGDQRSRVLRGGAWNYYPLNLRAAYRDRISPDFRNSNVGFRVARTVNP